MVYDKTKCEIARNEEQLATYYKRRKNNFFIFQFFRERYKATNQKNYSHMPTFWENVFRFPRFFIGTIIGLILTIVGPFFNLLRRPKTTIIFIILFLGIVGFILLTLQAMLGE